MFLARLVARRAHLALVLLVSALGAACSSAPAIPDSEAQAAAYRSAGNESQDAPAESPDSAQVPRATSAVATVNGQDIGPEQFNLEVDRLLKSGQFPPQLIAQIKDQLIQKLIDRHLVASAIAAANITVSAEEIDAKLAEVRREFEANAKAQGESTTLEDTMANMGFTQEELRQTLGEAIGLEKLLVSRGLRLPEEAEVRALYEEKGEWFEQPEQVHARHILVEVKAEEGEAGWQKGREKIDAIRTQVMAPGASFEDLARKESACPSSAEGGDLGSFGREAMVPEFSEVAFATAQGQVSEPVRTQFGWHLIKVENKTAAEKVAFEQVREQLAVQLRNQATQKALEGFLEEMRGSAKVEVHPASIP